MATESGALVQTNLIRYVPYLWVLAPLTHWQVQRHTSHRDTATSSKVPISKKSPVFDILEMYNSPIKELFEFDLCDHIVE